MSTKDSTQNLQNEGEEDESFSTHLNLRLSSNSAEEPTFEDNVNELMEFINNVMDPSNRLNKAGREGLKDRITAIAMNMANLAGQNKILREEVERLRKESQTKERISYARVTAQPAVATKSDKKSEQERKIEMRKEENTLFITSDKATTGRKVQEELTKVLNPRTEKIRINRMKTIGKALIIEAATKEDLEKIKNNANIKRNFKCELPKKRKPLVILYDVSSSAKEEDIKEDIRAQNFEHMSKEEFEDSFKIRFKTGPRGKSTVHYVAEVSPGLRKALIRDRIYIGFSAINAKDYIVVPKCLKCQDLGHVAKHCSKETACSHCGGAHEKKECDKAEQRKTCIPCKARGKAECNKDQKDCPTHKMLTDRLILKTDWGK
ncbi:uncharacterized protein LOC114339400 [Diabrotica virgifera virgifera]|uniref:Uncharacterized protein LOC114339400 n=1 Tax=Diabrotica virgifera virgifera TaxID=50390 RepID=A0A6P7GIS9_DIAVI|nr:uncharacterized protein LOC114339400 [Diabrotica virgifera virgifera]